MANLASKVETEDVNRSVPTSPLPSKLKTYGFAIAMIVCIGVLAAGLAGYFHPGALSNMAQIDAIIMIAFGVGGLVALLLIDVVSTVKAHQGRVGQQSNDKHADPEQSAIMTRALSSTERAEIIRSTDTQGGLFYGPAAWRIWNVEVVDIAPPAPKVDLSKNDKVLMYIPKRIRVHGKEHDLNLKTLKEITAGSYQIFHELVEMQFQKNTAPGWVVMDKNVIPESRKKDYATQKKMVEDRGCSLPSVLEAIVLNLMVFAYTGERLYGQEPWTFTRCIEKFDGKYPVIVGGYGGQAPLSGLIVWICSTDFDNHEHAVACALRNF